MLPAKQVYVIPYIQLKVIIYGDILTSGTWFAAVKGGVFMNYISSERKIGIKSSRQFWDSIPVTLIVSYILLIIGRNLISIFFSCLSFDKELPNNIKSVVENYYYFIFIWIPYVFFMLIYKPDRALLKKLLPKNSKKALLFPAGLAIGFAMNAACALIAVLRKDIHLYYMSANPLLMVFSFIGVFIQSGAEEVQMRLFVQQHLARGYKSPWISVLFPSVFFSFLHLGNPGIGFIPLLCIFLAGICFSLIVFRFDSIWMSIAVHTMWNYTQNFLFGLPNSGIVSAFSLFRLGASTAMDTFTYNVSFGIEGAWTAVIIFALTDIVLVFVSFRKDTGKAV